MSKKPAASQPQNAGQGHSTPAGLTDIATLRANARNNLDDGAMTRTYTADRKAMIGLLNAALATEYVCVLRYYRHYFMAKGMLADAVKEEFLEHAKQEKPTPKRSPSGSCSSAASPAPIQNADRAFACRVKAATSAAWSRGPVAERMRSIATAR